MHFLSFEESYQSFRSTDSVLAVQNSSKSGTDVSAEALTNKRKLVSIGFAQVADATTI